VADKSDRVVLSDGRVRYVNKGSFKDSVKALVSGLASAASPRILRERKSDLDDQERRYDGQSTDSNNRYD
jgi:hypothetical protein